LCGRSKSSWFTRLMHKDTISRLQRRLSNTNIDLIILN
jgi:hypothetical protein